MTSSIKIENGYIFKSASINSVTRGSMQWIRRFLHFFGFKKYEFIIELLLDNGADENIKDNEGKTPIEFVKNEEIKEFIRNYNSTKFVLK